MVSFLLLLVLFSFEQRSVAPPGDFLHVHGDIDLVDDLLSDQRLQNVLKRDDPSVT
ncbi:MAG TPA: hypothetical protein VMY37_15465 [Thermoguttaceae bacterium]|nr:hypothetical protein [Thermoguttaceae bacterium]